MTHVAVLAIAVVSFAALAAFIELCDRLIRTAHAEGPTPGSGAADSKGERR
jgi:hypothetical protein